MTAHPAGWYTSPLASDGGSVMRWWDGTRWTEQTQPVAPQQATTAAAEPLLASPLLAATNPSPTPVLASDPSVWAPGEIAKPRRTGQVLGVALLVIVLGGQVTIRVQGAQDGRSHCREAVSTSNAIISEIRGVGDSGAVGFEARQSVLGEILSRRESDIAGIAGKTRDRQVRDALLAYQAGLHAAGAGVAAGSGDALLQALGQVDVSVERLAKACGVPSSETVST